MENQLCLFERGKHYIFHNLEFNHVLRKRIEHENQVILI